MADFQSTCRSQGWVPVKSAAERLYLIIEQNQKLTKICVHCNGDGNVHYMALLSSLKLCLNSLKNRVQELVIEKGDKIHY